LNKMKLIIALVLTIIAAASVTGQLLPPEIEFVNADKIQVAVNGQSFPVNGSLLYWKGMNGGADTMRSTMTTMGQTSTTWVMMSVDSQGTVTMKGSVSLPNGSCVTQPPQPPSMVMKCTGWTPGMGPGPRTVSSTLCVISNNGRPLGDIQITATSINGMLKSVTQKTQLPDQPTPQTATITIVNQYDQPGDDEDKVPCSAMSQSNTVENVNGHGIHPLGGILGGIKCTACKLGVGAIVGKLGCSGGGGLCAAFPPAIPFCAVLSQAACKAGTKLGKDTACKIIHMC